LISQLEEKMKRMAEESAMVLAARDKEIKHLEIALSSAKEQASQSER
jgi:hypothetical protein